MFDLCLWWLNLGPTVDFVSGRSYVPGPFGLTYLAASGSFPLSLKDFWLVIEFKFWLYYPGPRGFDFDTIFLGDFPKVDDVGEVLNFLSELFSS